MSSPHSAIILQRPGYTAGEENFKKKIILKESRYGKCVLILVLGDIAFVFDMNRIHMLKKRFSIIIPQFLKIIWCRNDVVVQ